MGCTVKLGYYDNFRCLADNCPFTCCQEWAIAVDEETQNKWKNIKLSDLGIQDVANRTLCDCLEKDGSNQVITLKEDEKTCPFLGENKLCQVVVTLGEDKIADICRSYPRHTNNTNGHKEYSLDFGCPAVIDLLHEKGSSRMTEGEAYVPESFLEKVRAMIMGHLECTNYSLTERMMMTYYCLLDLLEQEEPTEAMIEEYTSEAYLDELVGEMRKLEVEESDGFWERNELFLDMEQLYLKEEHYTSYLEEVTQWAKGIEMYYADTELMEKYTNFEKAYGTYERLLKDYLVAETWASVLKDGMDAEDMTTAYMWILLEYAVMKQMAFLRWLANEEKELTYQMVKDSIMIVSRMAGYDIDDVKNCLEYSYETTILEWGHVALIIGDGQL
ncbi:MAG: flagellin lysine-N-methylase [Cellulosilyticaceae bacterium]